MQTRWKPEIWQAKSLWIILPKKYIKKEKDKAGLSDEIKQNFFQPVAVSVLLYRCTTWSSKKRLEKPLDSNCKRMLRAVLNKLWM